MTALVKHRTADFEQPERGASQYLTFLLDGEAFAVDILNIREIIEFGNLTTVPLMPEFIRGVINLRGAVVPVVDLANRLGRTVGAVTRRTCIVILDVHADTPGSGHVVHTLGMVVDVVNEVLDINHADIEPAPAFGTHIRSDFISGMGKVDSGFVIILDANRVLSVDEMTRLDLSVAAGR